MATIDIPSDVAELETQAAEVKVRIYGLENELRLDYSDEEKANLTALRAIYVQWASTIATLISNFHTLETLGYPVMPTMEVPDSMIATLTTEISQSQKVAELFHAPPPATAAEVAFTVTDQP